MPKGGPRGQPRAVEEKVRGAFAVALLLLLASTGCVKRTIIVESDPPGAKVWINEHPAGVTPVAYEFITHGRYKFRLGKPGFREHIAREMVRAPIYQWIGPDFIAEYLLPIRFEDKHVFRYALVPQPPAERLRQTPELSPQAALQQLQDPDPEKRRVACVTLAAARDPSTAQALLNATGDPIPVVRATALAAYRAVEGPRAKERLIQALHQDLDREVRWQAAAELEALRDPSAVPDLIEALEDRDPLVRIGAAEALKGIPDPRALQPLIRALKDKDTGVRRAATEGLGKIGDRAAVPALTRVLFHHDFQTRRRAAEALAKLKDPASGPALARTFTDWDPKVRQVATNALVQFGDERVVPLLIRRLRAWKPWTREHAARVLGGLKAAQAVGPLTRALERESDPPAREAMAEALVIIKREKLSSGRGGMLGEMGNLP